MTDPAPPPPPPPPAAKAPPAPAQTTTATATTTNAMPELAMPTRQRQGLRTVAIAVEKWGKTSMVAHMRKPAILMAREETGYTTLFNRGLVPAVLNAHITEWPQLLATLEHFADQKQIPFETLALDAIGGFERLCHEYVCETMYGGDWGPRGFANFGKGPDSAVQEILKMLQLLDRLAMRGVDVVILGHVIVKMHQNPMGENFDRYVCDVHQKCTWPQLSRWSDAILFGTFHTVVEKESKSATKGKAIGGTQRVLYTQRRDAFDAGNRIGLPPMLSIPADRTAIWSTIEQHIPQHAPE